MPNANESQDTQAAESDQVNLLADSQPDSDAPLDEASPAGESEDIAAQLQEANANYLRAKAEVENVLKRTRREIADERRYAALPVMRDLLTVVDNLQRAIDAPRQEENSTGLLEGVKMVQNQLETILDQHHCKKIKALAEPFNPNLHESIGQQPSDEIPANHVCQEIRVGYQLHDRVVRPSQVFISTGPKETDSPAT